MSLPTRLSLTLPLLVTLLLPGCHRTNRVPAHGHLAGKPVRTVVDDVIARDWLDARSGSGGSSIQYPDTMHPARPAPRPPVTDHGAWEQLANRTSTDLATILLIETLRADPVNRALEARFRHELEHLAPSTALEPLSGDSAPLVLFMPGWDYRESGSITGADFAGPRRIVAAMGMDAMRVPIDPVGPVEENAVALATTIREHGSRAILVVSASSGGPATALAMGKLLSHAESAHVRAWLNIGGILRGSPVADHYLAWPRSWLTRIILAVKGWDIASIRSMSLAAGRSRFASLRFPDHLRIVNYIGIPLSGQVSERARSTYAILRPLGPNDGLTLIADALVPGAATLVDIGRDHFVGNDPDIDRKTAALTRLMVGLLPDTTSTDTIHAGGSGTQTVPPSQGGRP